MFHRIRNRLDVRVRIGKIFRDPPAFRAAFGNGGRRQDQSFFLDGLLKEVTDSVEPALGRDVRLTLF